MKKICVLLVFLACNLSYGELNINWTSSGPSLLFDSLGAQLLDDGYIIQLVIDVGNNTDVNSMITSGQLGIGSETGLGGVNPAANASDDIVGTWDGNAWFFANPTVGHVASTIVSDVDPYASTRFYFRWFNSAIDQSSATEAGFIYNSANAWVSPPTEIATPPDADIAFGADANVTGSQNVGGTGWATVAPVPEPTTMALMGLGLVAVAARRRFAKKA